MPFFDLQTLVRVITPNQVAGIEVYNKGEFPALPEEFILPVTTCRVVMVWTREIDGATSDVYQGFTLGPSDPTCASYVTKRRIYFASTGDMNHPPSMTFGSTIDGKLHRAMPS